MLCYIVLMYLRIGIKDVVYHNTILYIIERFGYADWYGWQINNWGTKWNASSIQWLDEEFVTFNTAWSTPFMLFTKLSEKYPEARIEVEYSDEDFGYNVGKYTLVAGIEIECEIPEGGSYEALELAMKIQYGSVDDYFECNEEMFVEDVEDIENDEKLSEYISTIIDIAYDNECFPTEDCEYHKLVLEKFKEKALVDENFELVALIQKELEKVVK